MQNELRKAALERAGGGSRKAVLPPKDPKESSEPRVVDIDHLTRTQVIAGLMLYGQILLGLKAVPHFKNASAFRRNGVLASASCFKPDNCECVLNSSLCM